MFTHVHRCETPKQILASQTQQYILKNNDDNQSTFSANTIRIA